MLGLVGCGRLGFDPVDPTGDGALPSGDGRPGDGALADGPSVDALAAACGDAMPIGVGRTATIDTCTLIDRIDGCGPANTKEVIFRFVPPATQGYVFRAFDGATANTSNSTALINASCNGIGSCAGVLGTGGTAGQPMYLIVESSSGGCASIQFSIN